MVSRDPKIPVGLRHGQPNSCWRSSPPWLRHFFLYDVKPEQVSRLNILKEKYPQRHIEIYQGDFNELVDGLLASGKIKETEAAFAFLDQRTFECHWATVAKLAGHKHARKIELFYFLPNAWLERAFSGLKDQSVIEAWWGRGDWKAVRDASRAERMAMFATRFRRELGYLSACCWPIYSSQQGGVTMYYMIHATDHAEGPKQMLRAYKDCIRRPAPVKQLDLLHGEQ